MAEEGEAAKQGESTLPPGIGEEKSTIIRCPHCGQTTWNDGRPFKEWGETGVHTRTECKVYLRKTKGAALGRDASISPPTTEGARGPAREGEGAGQREPEDAKDENEVLDIVLRNYTDLSEPNIKLVTQWAELQGPIHPNALVTILTDECQIKVAKANMVVNKYAAALQKWAATRSQKPAHFFISGFPERGQQTGFQDQGWPPGWPGRSQPGYAQPGYGYPPGYAPSPIDARDEIRRVRDEMEDRFDKKFDDLKNTIQDLRQGGSQQDQYIEEYEPVIGADGKVLLDGQGAPALKKTVKPANLARGSGESMAEVYKNLWTHEKEQPKNEPMTEEKLKNMITAAVQATKEPLTEEKIRAIVKEVTAEKPLTAEAVEAIVEKLLIKQGTNQPREDPKVTELSNELKETKKDLDTMGKQMADQEKAQLNDRINQLTNSLEAMRGEIRNMPTGEWKSDELKILATSIHDLKDLVDKRKPVDTILEKGPKALRLFQLAPPMGEEPEPEPPPVEKKGEAQPPQVLPPTDEMTTELRKQGLTVRLT